MNKIEREEKMRLGDFIPKWAHSTGLYSRGDVCDVWQYELGTNRFLVHIPFNWKPIKNDKVLYSYTQFNGRKVQEWKSGVDVYQS